VTFTNDNHNKDGFNEEIAGIIVNDEPI